MKSPVLTIIAGANGAGKTTLTSYARELFQENATLDPDAIARSMLAVSRLEASQLRAGKVVLRRAEELLTKRESFTVETTLSGHTYINMAKRAKAACFAVALVFVGTDSVDVNLQRVRDRVRKGGHDVPEADQRRRWPRTLRNLERLLPMTDAAILLDNSTEQGYSLLASGAPYMLRWADTIPEWAVPIRQRLS